MFVDALRVCTDPMTSYLRLNKTFSRFSKLIYHYPFNLNSIYNKIEYTSNLKEKEYDDINTHLINLTKKLKLIVIGHKAFNRLISKAKIKNSFYIQEPYLELISTNFNDDRNKILDELKKKYGKDIYYEKYNPFFQFLDKSVYFYYKKELILKLYGRNEKCIVYDYSKKTNLYYGTYQLQLMYLFSNYFLSIVQNNNFLKKVYMTMITRLIYAKDIYLNNNNVTPLSKSSFQEFTMSCLGDS